MIYGYIRVSSDKQTVENQRYEIQCYCAAHSIILEEWIEETVSGTVNYKKRLIYKCMKKLKKGDMIICSEISRLGRSLFMIMDILSFCMAKGCKLRTVKENYILGNDLQSKVLAFAFGLAAEIERNLISQRTKEALSRKKAEGVKLGRPEGKLKRESRKLYKYDNYIYSMLLKGKSVVYIARRCRVDRSTLYRYINDYMRPEALR